MTSGRKRAGGVAKSLNRVFRQRLCVPFQYPVHFTRGVFRPAHPLLASIISAREPDRRHRVMAFIDAGVRRAHPSLPAAIAAYARTHGAVMELAAPPVGLAGGERAKSGWAGVERVTSLLARAHMDRQSYVLAIGGGGLLDLVGLAASLVHRGLRLIRMPTTALAQNDVGVGVKNGVDVGGAKNLIGTFSPPFAVLNDLDFLDTLGDEEWRGGMAEAFKVAMIKDRRFFDFLCRSAGRLAARERAAGERMIVRCAELHLHHIRTSGDPFEFGSARPLDYGHWSAHKLEALSSFRLSHGYAVAVGIALDAVYATRQGLLPGSDASRLLAGLRACGLPVWHPLLGRRDASGHLAVLAGLDDFREHLGGELAVTLPGPLGRRTEVHQMDSELIAECIAELRDVACGERP